ncbi:MAG: glycosyltransferase family 4 protein, partial [Candidatus Glassbacteria bacterium]
MSAEDLNGRSFRILLLVDFLPDPQQADPRLRSRHITVLRQSSALARTHKLTWPILVPYLAGAVRACYRLRGAKAAFPRPRDGSFAEIACSTTRYLFIPRLATRFKTAALLARPDVRGGEFDMVHCHSVFDLGLAGLEIKKRAGLPLVVTVHGTDVNWLFETDPARRASPRIAEATIRVLKGADAVIGVSRELCAKVEKLGVSPEKIHHVPNGVDRALFFPGDRAAERGKLGWPPDKKIILYVGNLLETKGLGELLEAARLLGGDTGSGDFQVVLTGPDCGFENELRRRIAGYGLAGKILFT